MTCVVKYIDDACSNDYQLALGVQMQSYNDNYTVPAVARSYSSWEVPAFNATDLPLKKLGEEDDIEDDRSTIFSPRSNRSECDEPDETDDELLDDEPSQEVVAVPTLKACLAPGQRWGDISESDEESQPCDKPLHTERAWCVAEEEVAPLASPDTVSDQAPKSKRKRGKRGGGGRCIRESLADTSDRNNSHAAGKGAGTKNVTEKGADSKIFSHTSKSVDRSGDGKGTRKGGDIGPCGRADKRSSTRNEDLERRQTEQSFQRGGKSVGKGSGKSSAKGVGKGAESNFKYEAQILIGIEDDKKFRVVRRIFGSGGENMKKIIAACERIDATPKGASLHSKLRLRGRGSGYLEGLPGEEQAESADDLMLCISCQNEEAYEQALVMARDLVEGIHRSYRTFCSKAGKECPPLSVREQVHKGNRNSKR